MSTSFKTAIAAAICGIVSIGAGLAEVRAADWPQFHGAAGDNISTETGLLKQWPDGGPELVWTAKGMGDGFASVSVADGLVYTAGNIDGKTVITAMDLDGKVLWQTPCGEGWTKSFPGVRATPTIDGDRLYFESPLGDVVCLDAKTGEQLWGLNILEKFGGQNIQWALAESVVIDGDNAICCPFGSQGSIVALDKRTGETVWVAESVGDKAGYATATLAEFAGLRMVLAMSAKALVGVNADNGDLLFRYEHLTKHDVNALKPICADGRVFISSGYKAGSEMVQLTAAGGKVTAEQAWESKDMDNHHGGVILWDGYLYGADSKRNWVCFDWDSGETKYSESGVGKGSATCADGMLYTFAESGGKVGLVKPTPEGHQVVSEFQIPKGGEGKSWAHPVVCGGRLYLRHGDFLFVYDVKN
jgi:outer membrane protein assembly factor BamB